MDGELFYICELCQTLLDMRHGEAVCPNCGRTLDASDLIVVQANAYADEESELHPCPGSDLRDFVPKAPPRDEPLPAGSGEAA
jgi:hypothetical protein